MKVIALAVLAALMAVAMMWFSGCQTAESRKTDEFQRAVLECVLAGGQPRLAGDGDRIVCQ